ncbi:MAG: CapA family protein [Clostridia bacterium]|nr:CapA family protein [Clostridia bacterium]
MAEITIVGDMLCSPRMTEIANGNYSPLFERANKLKNCDYLIGNLETPIAGSELKYTYERYRFNTPIEFLDAIKACGFDMLTLANNHCMDRDETGLLNTIRNCKEKGFDVVGAYESKEERNKIFIKDIDGIKVAFINYTYGTNAFAHKTFLKNMYMVNLIQPEETKKGSIHLLNDYEQIAEDVERIYLNKTDEYTEVKPYLEQLERDIKYAKENSDYVIMLLHCGGQYIEKVDPYSKFIVEKIKEYGADVVIGNHQHIIQSCDLSDDYLRVYCLGNMLYDNRIKNEDFYFDSPSYNAVLHLELKKDKDGKIKTNKCFSIYTTAFSDNGLPIIIDSADIFKINRETYVKSQILHYANLFAGEDRYKQVEERYEL